MSFLHAGCKNFNSAEGKANAQKLGNTGLWTVIDTSEDTTTPGRGMGTMERTDCTADVAITVKPATGTENDKIYLSIHQSNPQYSTFKALKIGDTVSFQQVIESTQTKCGDGAYVRLKQ